MEKLYHDYQDRASVYIVYIREAHPADGWQVGANLQEKIVFDQPTTLDQRTHVAKTFCSALKISIPCLLDGMDDKVNQAYAGWPDRIYVIDVKGQIVYKGAPGPRGFKPAEAMEALKKIVVPPPTAAPGSSS